MVATLIRRVFSITMFHIMSLPNPEYSNALQTVLLAILVLCLFGTICSLTTKSLHRIVIWFAPINSTSGFELVLLSPSLTFSTVLASISICIALLVLTPNKQSATWVFTHVTDGSGWGSKGFSFFLG